MAIFNKLFVSNEALEEAISQYEAKKELMESTCQKMLNEVNDLMNTYKGEAANKFQSQFNDMYKNLQENTTEMENAISDLKKARETYGSFEAAIGKLIEAIEVFKSYM